MGGSISQVSSALGTAAVACARPNRVARVDFIIGLLRQQAKDLVRQRGSTTGLIRLDLMRALNRVHRAITGRKRLLRARETLLSRDYSGLTKFDLDRINATRVLSVLLPHEFSHGSIPDANANMADTWKQLFYHNNLDLDPSIFSSNHLPDDGSVVDHEGNVFGIVDAANMQKAALGLHKGKAADQFFVHAEILQASPNTVFEYAANPLREKLENQPVPGQPRNPLHRKAVQSSRLRMSPKKSNADNALHFRPLLLQLMFLKLHASWFYINSRALLVRNLPIFFVWLYSG